jgi:hypothetical protein
MPQHGMPIMAYSPLGRPGASLLRLDHVVALFNQFIAAGFPDEHGASLAPCPCRRWTRRAAIDAALDGLAAYEFGAGHDHGLREYWRKRHESNNLPT